MKKFFQAIKNNPKKSIFGSLVCAYVGNWINGLHRDHVFRHAMCHSILPHGTEPVHWLHEPKNITIFLNPAANNGKGSKLFEKNAAPILHLSGCNVKIVKLEYEGEAKQLMSVLENTDVIVAAGGNGTVSEVITGLLRRPDYQDWQHTPIGIIPLGKTNTLCRQLCTNCDPSNTAQWIMTATADILKNTCRPVDVMKVKADTGKTVYAVSDIRWGSYSEANGKTDKYWYFGPLKKYMTYVFASFRSKIQTPCELELSYSDPKFIAECSNDNITSSNVNMFKSAPNILGSKILHILQWLWNGSGSTEVKPSVSHDNIEEDLLENTTNSKTYDRLDVPFKTLEFMASANIHSACEKRNEAIIQIDLEKEDFRMFDFISNGTKHFMNDRPKPTNSLTEIHCSQFKIVPITANDIWFKIDNEDYEAMTCEVELLPNMIKMVCSESSI